MVVACALAGALADGCGGAGTAHRTTKAPSPAYSYQPGALVTMRALSPESLLWQTISIRADGTGLLTTIVGEISGAKRKHFRLSATEAGRLRRLVRAARAVRPTSSHDPRATLYALTLPGRQAESLQGRMPRPLSALVNDLSGLMLTYCC